MEEALDRADDVLIEGRDRVKDLRVHPRAAADLPQAIEAMGGGAGEGTIDSLQRLRRRNAATAGPDRERGSTAHSPRGSCERFPPRTRHEDRNGDYLPSHRIATPSSRRRLRDRQRDSRGGPAGSLGAVWNARAGEEASRELRSLEPPRGGHGDRTDRSCAHCLLEKWPAVVGMVAA